MLTEGVLGGGGAARVLAAVSQHALVAAAAPAVVKQGRLAHGWRKLPTQHAAVGTRMKMELKTKQANSFFFLFLFDFRPGVTNTCGACVDQAAPQRTTSCQHACSKNSTTR